MAATSDTTHQIAVIAIAKLCAGTRFFFLCPPHALPPTLPRPPNAQRAHPHTHRLAMAAGNRGSSARGGRATATAAARNSSSRLVPPSTRQQAAPTPAHAALLANESIKEFLLGFPKTQWPVVLEVRKCCRRGVPFFYASVRGG